MTDKIATACQFHCCGHSNSVIFNQISFNNIYNFKLIFFVYLNLFVFSLQLEDGYILYTYTNSLTPQQFLFEDVAVDDGQWHYFEARWRESGHLIMLLDYGQRQVRVCLIWFFTSRSTIFQLCRDGSSWVEPVLSKD